MLVPFRENLCSKHAEKMLSIKICNQCNMSCSFCVDRGGRSCKNIDVEKIAKEAIGKDKYKTIIITGGEPFLVFDSVILLCKLLRPYKTKIILNTNGSMLSTEKVALLNGLIDELQVSIHHYNETRNGNVFGKVINFQLMKNALNNKKFILSINSTFNKEYSKKERIYAVGKMVDLCKWIGASRLRLTELKKVDGEDFILADEFFPPYNEFINRSSDELVTKGCTDYYKDRGVMVSVKRLCKYAKGTNAIAFSCCFINENGQKKIDIDTKDTFKVIYSDGLVTDDWIFNKDKITD